MLAAGERVWARWSHWDFNRGYARGDAPDRAQNPVALSKYHVYRAAPWRADRHAAAADRQSVLDGFARAAGAAKRDCATLLLRHRWAWITPRIAVCLESV